MQVKEEGLVCQTGRGGRADKSIARACKQGIWLVITMASQDQALQHLAILGGPTLESGSGFPLLLVAARGRGAPSHPVPKPQPLLRGTEALLSGDTQRRAWLSCSARFSAPRTDFQPDRLLSLRYEQRLSFYSERSSHF